MTTYNMHMCTLALIYTSIVTFPNICTGKPCMYVGSLLKGASGYAIMVHRIMS